MSEVSIKVPKDITAKLDNNILTVTGPRGSIKKDFSKIRVYIELIDNEIKLRSYSKRRSSMAVLGTASSLIENMFKGVTKGYTYKLKVVSAHFPISVKVKGDHVLIENFYGGKAPRIAKIVGSCKVSVEGDDVIVEGISNEEVGQTAANIEAATTVKRKDQRVFLDGVYIYERS
ncbi:MAG: 50S ribosomal protein L6 [Nitrososphaeria archaeon]